MILCIYSLFKTIKIIALIVALKVVFIFLNLNKNGNIQNSCKIINIVNY